MKHEINNIKEKLRRIRLFIKVFDAEILLVALVITMTLSIAALLLIVA